MIQQATEEKPYISTSQLNTLARCGMQYVFRYEEGLILPPGVAAATGIGLHKAAAENGSQKIDSHEDLPVSDLKDIAAESFDTQLDTDGIWLNPEEASIGSKKVLGAAKDRTVELAEFYGHHVAEDYQPKHVEQPFRIELSGPRDFLGIIDLIDDGNNVTDFKTAARSKSKDEADKSVQLTAYAAGCMKITGAAAATVRLDTMVTKKTGVDRQVLESTRTVADFEPLADRVNAAVRVIEAGAYLPADPTHWCCSPKWCGYFHQCPFGGGKKQ